MVVLAHLLRQVGTLCRPSAAGQHPGNGPWRRRRTLWHAFERAIACFATAEIPNQAGPDRLASPRSGTSACGRTRWRAQRSAAPSSQPT
eukprot:200735-Pyramimonas_sp.AAC.1